MKCIDIFYLIVFCLPSGKVNTSIRKGNEMKRKNGQTASVFDHLRPTAILLSSSALIVFFSLLISMYEERWIYLPLSLSLILLEFALFWVFATLGSKKRIRRLEKLTLLDQSTLSFLLHFSDPVTIIGENGDLLWYNDSFARLFHGEKPSQQTRLQTLLEGEFSLRSLRDRTTEEMIEDPMLLTLNGEDYELVAYNVATEEKECYLAFWKSLHEVCALKSELAMRNPVLSYIAVDNFEGAAGTLQGNYRTIAAKISVLLKEWTSEVHGVLQEIDSDRYILVIEEKDLKTITDKKYDILDRVRSLSENSVDIPVTISIGSACIDGSMAEKDLAARQALDLALQRGGDQAVLKCRDNATEYYGGKTKTVQKRTKIKSRVVATEVQSLLASSSNVLIMGHRFADHDSIGSCIGMARFAMHFCPKVNIVVNIHDTNLKAIFKKLSGLAEYRNIFIDAASAQDLISSSTLLIVTDVNNTRQFEAPELFQNCATTVIIDHHRQSAEFVVKPTVTYIEPSASSASELVAEMIEQQLPAGSLLKEEAELLFAGIVLDTKQFANNTGPRTFSAAHFLRSEGANPAEAQMLFRSELEDFKREIKYESNAFIYREVIAFSYIEENATQEDKIAAAKAADRLLSLDGVLASFVLCRIDQTVHISARSSGTVNVQLITENLGGGGHFDMAGAQVVNSSIKDTFVLLKEAIDQYLNEV